MNRRGPLVLAAAAALLAALPVRGHEVLHEVQLGKAIAVRAYFADGEVLAYTAYEVYAPSDPKIPWQKGRTDRAGWLAFVPDQPGRWRVKVVDSTGHGLDLEVDAAAPPPGDAGPSAGSTAAFALRPLVGVGVIGAIFAALWAFQRRKGRRP